jgi:FixJ family two-component response regulator
VQAFESGEAFLEAVDLRQPGCVILDLAWAHERPVGVRAHAQRTARW